MASFAKIGPNGIVERVESIVNEVLKDSNGIEQEAIGVEFLRNLYNEPNAVWKKTSYNTHCGKHYLPDNSGLSNTQEKAFRKNHASIGFTYDENRDAFIPIKPHNSWILNETTCCWEAPVPYPSTFTLNLKKPDNTPREDIYEWDEDNINWKLVQL